MLGKFCVLILILIGYVYLTSNNDKTLFSKAKNACCKIYKEVEKSDIKIKVNKPQSKERRFF